MISIGVQYGGPEQDGTALERLLRASMKAVAEVRGPLIGGDDFSESARSTYPASLDFEVEAVPEVNVVFYVPGSLLEYEDLTKIEAARFSRKRKLLLVAVPVPKGDVRSGGSVDFVVDALNRANQIAAETFAKKGVGPFDIEKAEAIVVRAGQILVEQGF